MIINLKNENSIKDKTIFAVHIDIGNLQDKLVDDHMKKTKLNFKELGKLAQCIIFNTLFDCYLANLFIDK